MVPLTAPWALLGAALAGGALVAIYLFQRRHRERKVSSLLLWAVVRTPAAGGRTREPLRMPLTFWLELAALALLALAMAGPLAPVLHRARPLVIVLDDSLSMQVARSRARSAVEFELNSDAHAPVRIILAGDTPRMADASQLNAWTCNAPSADLEAAIALALRSGGPNALILVVTDHAPTTPLQPGRMKWIGVGSKVSNLAFTGAARSASERDRATFEIANFAESAQSTDFTIGAAGRELTRMRVDLGPRARRRIDFDIPLAAGPIDAAISGGPPFDDHVTLLPERRPPVKVQVDVTDQSLRESITNALDASQRATQVSEKPEVFITDSATSRPRDPATQIVAIDTTRAQSAYIAPFTVDRTHPLTDGVAFEGVIWGAAAAAPGKPIVIASNRTLIGEDEQRAVHIALDPATSNLQRSPAWPAIIWNLLDWRSGSAPGFHFVNVPLGGTAIANTSESGVVRAPDGTQRDVRANPVIAATQTGTWSLRVQNATYRFACNALLPEESDFERAASGTWGGWSGEALETNGYTDVTAIALLIALGLLVVHQRFTAESAA